MEFLYLIGLLVLGYVVGTLLEQRHYRSIRQREESLRGTVLVFSDEGLPPLEGKPDFRLVAGSVVVSIDYFKKFSAKIHSFFGGRLSAYESLLDRARREAMLRMRERAKQSGASMVFGVRLEVTSINNGNPNLVTGVEMIAYGTAIVPVSALAAPVTPAA